jgi:hypothetical protein
MAQLTPGHYRCHGIDPGWLGPAARRIIMRIQLPGDFSAPDLLCGETLAIAEGGIVLEVPAGALCIPEVVKRSP